MVKNRNDFAAGILFVAAGLFYGALSLSLPVGNTLDMGPGYFPLVLCGLLVLLGSAILGKSLIGTTGESFGKVPWRAVVILPLSIVLFGAGLAYLGLLPTVFATALVASLSSSSAPLKMAVATSLFLAIFCTLIFVYGVGLHVPVLGSWLVN